jgi:hypothetical protein
MAMQFDQAKAKASANVYNLLCVRRRRRRFPYRKKYSVRDTIFVASHCYMPNCI